MKIGDFDALKEELLRMGFFPAIVKAAIERMPTVDAVPVLHASWVDRFGGKYANSHYECSNCKKSAPYKRERDVLGKVQWVQDFADLSYYCPNCGAKMYGGNDDG